MKWVDDFIKDSKNYAELAMNLGESQVFRLIKNDTRDSSEFAEIIPDSLPVYRPVNHVYTVESISRAIYAAFTMIELDGRFGRVSAWEERGPKTCSNMLEYYSNILSLFVSNNSIVKAKKHIYNVASILSSKNITALTEKEVSQGIDVVIYGQDKNFGEPAILEEASLLWATAELISEDVSTFFRTHPDTVEDLLIKKSKRSVDWLIGESIDSIITSYKKVHPYLRNISDPNLFDVMGEIERLESVALLETIN